MNKFNLSQGLLNTVSSLLKTSASADVPLQEKIRRDNATPKQQQDAFMSTYVNVVAEERKKEAERQAKFAEDAKQAHLRMGKSIVEAVGGSAPTTTREKALAAKKAPKDKITHADVLAARGVKLEEIGITDELLDKLAAVVAPLHTKRYSTPLGEHKEVIGQMTRTLILSMDQMFEANVPVEIRAAAGYQKALAEAKAALRSDLLNSINVGSAVDKVNEGSKIKKILDDAFGETTLKSRKAKAQADVSDEVVRTGETVEEGWDDMLKDVKKRMGPQPNGGAGVKKGTRYGGANQKNDTEDKKVVSEEEVNEMDKSSDAKMSGPDRTAKATPVSRFKRFAKKVMDTVSHPSDEDLLKDLKKKAGVQEETVLASEAMDTPGNGYTHQCAVHVKHAKLGEGKTLFSQHAEPDADGYIAWYDVMFEEGILRVNTKELEILVSESHMNHKKKK